MEVRPANFLSAFLFSFTPSKENPWKFCCFVSLLFVTLGFFLIFFRGMQHYWYALCVFIGIRDCSTVCRLKRIPMSTETETYIPTSHSISVTMVTSPHKYSYERSCAGQPIYAVSSGQRPHPQFSCRLSSQTNQVAWSAVRRKWFAVSSMPQSIGWSTCR